MSLQRELVDNSLPFFVASQPAARPFPWGALSFAALIFFGVGAAVAFGAVSALRASRSDVIVHEMTAIPAQLNLRKFDRTFGATNTLRTVGLDHLLAAARAAGVPRFIAQSYAGWPNTRTGGPVKTEEDPLDPDPPAAMRSALDAIRYLERAVTSAPLSGLALRYGSLYGPGSSDLFVSMLRRRMVPLIGSAAGVW